MKLIRTLSFLSLSIFALTFLSCKKEPDQFIIQGTLLDKETSTPVTYHRLKYYGSFHSTIFHDGTEGEVTTDEKGRFGILYDRIKYASDSSFNVYVDGPTAYFEIKSATSSSFFKVELPINVNINQDFFTDN